MLGFLLGEVPLRFAFADFEIAVLGEEAEVGNRVDLAAVVSCLVEDCLGEDMMNLQTREMAKHCPLELEATTEIARTANASQEIKERIEARTHPVAGEIVGSNC